MPWTDAIEDGLPPPRESEPQDLRGDIADELADHLRCAQTRELRRTDDEDEADRRVLNRFGDPRAVAKQLWWIAMKEIVMKDRMMMMTLAAVVLLCAAMLVVAWSAMQQMSELNAVIVEKLSELSTPVQAPASHDWTSVSITLTDPDGQPLDRAGYEAQLQGHAIQVDERVNLRERPDEEGRVLFEPIRPGKYHLFVTTPVTYSASAELVVLPGRTYELEVRCPIHEPIFQSVMPAVTKPENMQDLDLYFRLGITRVDEDAQNENDVVNWYTKQEISDMVIGPTGILLVTASGHSPSSYEVDRYLFPPQSEIKLPLGTYRIRTVVVLLPKEEPADGFPLKFRELSEWWDPDDYGLGDVMNFEVTSDAPSRPNLSLPPRVWKQVRERYKKFVAERSK